MLSSGASDRGVTNIGRPVDGLGITDQWYDARCIECQRRHRPDAEVEEEEDGQELKEHSTRSNLTAKQPTRFCLLRRRSSRPPTDPPFSRDGMAQSASGQAMGMEKRDFQGHESDQYPPVAMRKAPKMKSSGHGLRDRLKQSISNMSLRTAFRDDVQEYAKPYPTNRLKSSESNISLHTGFQRQQSPVDADRSGARGLRNALSNMSLRRAFQRKEPDFRELSDEEVQDELIPQRRKRLATYGDIPARGLGLREAISNISLRASSRDFGPSEEPFCSLSRKRHVKAGDLSSWGLRESISSIALRAGFTSSEPDDVLPKSTPERRKRLAIAGQLPPRGQVLTPPIPESPRNSTHASQLIVQPEYMLHNLDTADVEDAGDMYVATRVQQQVPTSTVRRDTGTMDTLGNALAAQRKNKYCDPATLAILTGASYTTSAENYLDYRPDTSDPFAQGYFSNRRAGRYMDREDHGYGPQSGTSSQLKSSSPQNRGGDVTEMRDSELFAGFSSGSRTISVAEDDASEKNNSPTPRPEEQVTPWSKLQNDGVSYRSVKRRSSGQSYAISWAQGNADEFANFVDAAEHDMI